MRRIERPIATPLPYGFSGPDDERNEQALCTLQLSKIPAILYGIMGLLFLPLFIAISAFSTLVPTQQHVGMMALGAGFVIAMFFRYAVMGFLFGALGALIDNVVAK